MTELFIGVCVCTVHMSFKDESKNALNQGHPCNGTRQYI